MDGKCTTGNPDSELGPAENPGDTGNPITNRESLLFDRVVRIDGHTP